MAHLFALQFTRSAVHASGQCMCECFYSFCLHRLSAVACPEDGRLPAGLLWVDGFEAGCYVQRVVHPLCLAANDMMGLVSMSRDAGACTGWRYHMCSCCQFQAASAASGVMIVTVIRVPGPFGMAVHVCVCDLGG